MKIITEKARRLLAGLAGLMLLFGAGHGEGTARTTPESADEIPAVINRVSDPAAGSGFSFPEDARVLHIWFPNIMNADEAILMYGDEAWLIDCGDERMGARGSLLIRKLGIQKIDRLFNSHPHHDHLDGLKRTHETAKVEALYICFDRDATKSMSSAVQYASKNGIEILEYGDGSEFAMGDGAVTLTVRMNDDPKLDINNRSAQTMIRYGNRTILFTADMEKPGQKAMLQRIPAEELKADLLKYPHHGKTEMDDAYLEAVSPEAAIITNQRMEHWKGFRYLKKKKIPYIYTNRKNVYLHLMTDGEHWILEQVPRDRVEEKPKTGS